jgi:hypothetical protein
MHKARIRTVQVLRCAIYATDSAVLLAIPVAFLLPRFVGLLAPAGISIAGRNIFLDPKSMLIFAAVTAILSYRLSIAYRRYLGFPHAIAVGVASQVIVILTLLWMSPWGWIV